VALTNTALGTGTAGSGGFITSVATGSVSPTANRLVLAVVFNAAFNVAQAEPPDTVAGAGLSFELIKSEADTTTGVCISMWRALSASPSSGAITATWSHSMYYGTISVTEVDGIDTSGSNGAGAVVQSASSRDSSGSATSSAVTLSAFGNANNGAAFGTGRTLAEATIRTCTPDTGWTEIHDFGTNYASGAASASLETQFRASNDTTATGTWSSAGYIHSVAIEIKAAGSGSSTTVTPAQAALSLLGLASGNVTTLTPASATLTLSGKIPGTSAFTNVRIREVLVNGSGQLVGSATDIGLRVWYSGICAGPPDVSLNGMTTDANGTTSWSIATGALSFNQPIFYVAQNSVSYSHYACGRLVPSYE